MTENDKDLGNNNFIFYATNDGDINIRVFVDKKNETIWLNQKQLAELFDCSADNISLHIKNIFRDNELNENSVTEEYSITANDKEKSECSTTTFHQDTKAYKQIHRENDPPRNRISH